MSDVVTGLRQVIQDLVAPELKAHTVKLDVLQKQVETLQSSLQKQTEALQGTMQKHMETLQKQAEIQHDVLVKTLDAFRGEMRTDFALLRAGNQI